LGIGRRQENASIENVHGWRFRHGSRFGTYRVRASPICTFRFQIASIVYRFGDTGSGQSLLRRTCFCRPKRVDLKYLQHAHDEPLFGLGCQESVRDLVPFFLALLTRFLVGSRVRVPRRPKQCQ
jgi:hypothetical protein